MRQWSSILSQCALSFVNCVKDRNPCGEHDISLMARLFNWVNFVASDSLRDAVFSFVRFDSLAMVISLKEKEQESDVKLVKDCNDASVIESLSNTFNFRKLVKVITS